MPDYRRWRIEGGTYFFTLVTHRRRRLFHSDWTRRVLRGAIRRTRRELPWDMLAVVLLPDHLHMLWRLPEGEADYSTRIKKMKRTFTVGFLAAGGQPGAVSPGEQRKGYRGIWQPRFWEHTVRDARDFKLHLDYIHANPVKHSLVDLPRDWPFSSFHRYVKLGEYEEDWCGRVELPDEVEYYEYNPE